ADPLAVSFQTRFAIRNTYLPDILAGLLVHRQEEGPFARSAVENNQVIVKDRRGRRAPYGDKRAEITVPELLAVEIVADHTGGAVRCDHPLAVSHRGSGTVRIGVVRWLLALEGDRLLPQQLTVGAVEAEDGPLGSLLIEGLGEKDPLAPND